MLRAAHLGVFALSLAIGFSPVATAHAADTPVKGDDGSVSLSIRPQVQQKNQWCWLASGAVLADYLGVSVSQQELCNRAHGRELKAECPNEPGALNELQRGYRSLGMQTGFYSSSALTQADIRREIDGNRPALARIGWSSGGGHVLVVYGYKTADDTMMWADPWPSNKRLNVSKYSYFKKNSDFTWTHSLSYVKKGR